MVDGARKFAFWLVSLIVDGVTEPTSTIEQHVLAGDIVQYLDKTYSDSLGCFFGKGGIPVAIGNSLSSSLAAAPSEAFESLASRRYAIDNPDAGLPILLNLTIDHLI